MGKYKSVLVDRTVGKSMARGCCVVLRKPLARGCVENGKYRNVLFERTVSCPLSFFEYDSHVFVCITEPMPHRYHKHATINYLTVTRLHHRVVKNFFCGIRVPEFLCQGSTIVAIKKIDFLFAFAWV